MEMLSDDVLLEVFEYLDGKMLKNAALVCKNWNDVIGLSPSTMKKFRLKLSFVNNPSKDWWCEKFYEIMNLQRKYQSMSVFLCLSIYNESSEMLQDIIARNGSQIRSLLLDECEFEHPSDFCNLMANLPLLEEFEIKRTKFKPVNDEDMSTIQPVALKHLKTLSVHNTDWTMFTCLVGSKLTSLKVSDNIHIRPKRHCLINFLEDCPNLQSLEVASFSFMKIFESETQFPFRLKFFKFVSYLPLTELLEVDSYFINFFEAQASSLEELELNYLTRELLWTVLSKLIRLRKLRLNSDSLLTDREFYDQLKPMKSLKELILHDKIPNETAARGILGNCPNLEILKAVHDPNNLVQNMLPRISIYNTKLKSLIVESVNVQYEPPVIFKFLEFLHVDTITSLEHLLSFIKNNPTVTTLSFRWLIKETIKKVLDALMETNVKHLKFIGKFEVLKKIYDKLKVDYKKLKSLELNMNTGSKKGLPVFSFEFPDDVKKWDQRCEFFDSN